MSTDPAASRLAGLDAAKGLAIVGVVLIHAGPTGSGLYQDHVVNGVARLAVPCFLAITGYLAGLKGTGRPRMRGYLRRFVGLHLLYGAFYWALSTAFNGPPDSLTLKYVLSRFGEAAFSGQYYFVILIQTFLITSLLPERSWRSPLALAATIAAAGSGLWLLQVLFEMRILRPTSIVELLALRAVASPNAIWLWLCYFVLGAMLGDRVRRGLPPPAGGRWMLAAGLGLGALAWPDWPYWGEPTYLPYTRLPIYLAAGLVTLGLPAIAPLGAPRPLARLGAESFGVFVLNPAILACLVTAFGVAQTPAVAWLYAAFTLATAFALCRPLRRWAPFALP